MKKINKMIALLLGIIMIVSLVGCKKSEKVDNEETPTKAAPTQEAKPEVTKEATPEPTAVPEVKADTPANYRGPEVARSKANEENPLVLSTMTLDGKFSPFFGTSGYDQEIYGATQLGLIANNDKAELVAGNEEPCVAWKYDMSVNSDNTESIYKFWIKNGIHFSDGHILNADDVLFNIYTFIDPLYDGSSTMYSLDIEGLKAYRTQTPDEDASDAKMAEFAELAQKEVDDLLATKTGEVYDKIWEDIKVNVADDSASLQGPKYTPATFGLEFPDDFKETNNQAMILAYTSATLEKPLFAYKDGAYVLDPSTGLTVDGMAGYTQEDYITASYNAIKEALTPAEYDAAFGFNNVAKLYAEYTTRNKTAYLQANKGTVKNISGIVKGKEVCEDGVERETITITLKGVDPTAILKFSFSIAPMHYYAGQEAHDKANGVDYFGVDFSDPAFILKMKEKNGLPMGAGPYKVTDASGSDTPTADGFYSDGICYFKANDLFIMSAPKIKYIRYKTIADGSQLDALLTGEVHYSDPDARPDSINLITSDEQYKALQYCLVDNLGYGYIGMSGRLIPNINERRALMSAMDTSLTLNQYPGGLAAVIYRPMSTVSWAYPEGADNMYPFDETGETSKQYFLKAGFKEQADGTLLKPDGSKPSYKFTLPSSTEDHPAGQVFLKTQEILAKLGVEVIIEVDSTILNKLQQEIIPVWSAAWSASLDPDMFQVYYSDPKVNQAGSPKSTGLYYMYENGSDEEKQILKELNELIIQGRSTLNSDERKPIYAKALEKAMEIAVELPTYQRKNMFVFNKTVIDPASITPADKITPYTGPLFYIWNVSLLDQ